MKPTHLFTIIALTLAGCHKPIAEDPPAPPVAPAVEPAPPVAVPPSPAQAVSTPAPLAKAPAEVAPEGIFYLVSVVSVETPEGITALPPGTGVKLVGPGVYLTPAGEAPIALDRLTNDKALARAARDAYRTQPRALPPAVTTQAAPMTPPPVPEINRPAKQVAPPVPYTPNTSALGATHSRTKDGWLWNKNAKGEWVKVKRL